MSLCKVLAGFAAMALGAAAVLAFPGLSYYVDAGLSPFAVKSDRLISSEPVKPEQVKLEQAKPQPAKLEQAKPEQIKPEQAKLEQVKLEQAEQAKPEPATPEQAKPNQAKSKQAKSKQVEPRLAAKAKGCADNTWSYYEVKCQRTRTRVVNGVRTTRIVPNDPEPQN